MSNTTIRLKLRNFFRQIATQYYIEMVFLYGSWAFGRPHKESDVDLAILFSDEMDDPDEIFSLLGEITYRLIKKLRREVNIIAIDKSFSHPMLYYNAIVSGIPIFIKDNDRYLSLKLEAIHQMEDFQIYGVGWQREITRKIIRELSDV